MRPCVMGEAARVRFESIPSFLGLPVGDLEDLEVGQIALAGYFCDNLSQPRPGQRYLARQLRYASQRGDAPANALDLGDLNVFPLEPEKHVAAVTRQCSLVLGAGARLVLIGGDASGLASLSRAAEQVMDAKVSVRSLSDQGSDEGTGDKPVILSVDLKALGAAWLSQPRQLNGLSPAEMINRIEAVSGEIVAAAVFGLAPALDARGDAELRASLAIVQAVVRRLEEGAA